jgi:choline dehydrogenase
MDGELLATRPSLGPPCLRHFEEGRPMDLAPSYDLVVIGAGTAGSILDARLSENAGRSVLLLEADPHDTDPRISRPASRPASCPALLGSALDRGDRATPQPGLNGRRLAWPRGAAVSP